MKICERAYGVSIGLLIGAALIIVWLSARPAVVVQETKLEKLPMEIMEFSGPDMRFEDAVYAVLNTDANIFRVYRTSDMPEIALYIGYYGTAKGGRATHLPQACYTGHGWAIDKWDFMTLEGKSIPPTRINRMIVKKGDQRQLVYFWFQSETTVMATGLEQNWHKLQHRLLYNRNDGAFIRVSMNLAAGEEDRIEERAKAFSLAIMPLVSQFWPVERSIES